MHEVAEQTLAEILEREWTMFQGVRGLDGPASCQQDRRTFDIMRAGQVQAWNEDVAQSYLNDLRRAEESGRNLMTEKYARMMQSTSPREYRGFGEVLPDLDPHAVELVDRVARQSVRLREEVEDRYPFLSGRGRPIRAWADDPFTTSFETYLRGELATYSTHTLELLEEHYQALEAVGRNPAEMILSNTVEHYGFGSLEEAEAAMKSNAEKRSGTQA